MPIFYDPMISKLVAWAEDRPRAIARMRRALGEYLVVGIKTTVPFFTWLLEQADFVEGRFHTAYLDEVLARRNGQPFVAASADTEEVAAIGVAIQSMFAPDPAASANGDGRVDPVARRWKAQARVEGLRGAAGD